MLGHEMRNPLAPILTSLHLMRLRGGKSQEQNIIERQVDHLVRLVDDLLDISRITRGKVDLKKERLELIAAVLRGMEMASPLLEARRQHVDIEVPPEGLAVVGDLDRLAQVISNLLTNAAKYSSPGSTIRISADRAAPRVRLRVRDRGVGIAHDMLARIFEPFVQETQSLERSKGGLGLGLAIVRSLVELHGGSVSVSSEGLGHGAEFVVDLPLAPDAIEYQTLDSAPVATRRRRAAGGESEPHPRRRRQRRRRRQPRRHPGRARAPGRGRARRPVGAGHRGELQADRLPARHRPAGHGRL